MLANAPDAPRMAGSFFASLLISLEQNEHHLEGRDDIQKVGVPAPTRRRLTAAEDIDSLSTTLSCLQDCDLQQRTAGPSNDCKPPVQSVEVAMHRSLINHCFGLTYESLNEQAHLRMLAQGCRGNFTYMRPSSTGLWRHKTK